MSEIHPYRSKIFLLLFTQRALPWTDITRQCVALYHAVDSYVAAMALRLGSEVVRPE